MTLRRRLTLAAGGRGRRWPSCWPRAVAYLAVRASCAARSTTSCARRPRDPGRAPAPAPPADAAAAAARRSRRPRAAAPSYFVQLVDAGRRRADAARGEDVRAPGPTRPAARVAAGRRATVLRDRDGRRRARARASRCRWPGGGAVVVRPLARAASTACSAGCGWSCVLVCVGGVALAAVAGPAGRAAASWRRSPTSPRRPSTSRATDDLGRRIDGRGPGRGRASWPGASTRCSTASGVASALGDSPPQRQLVADASHELRTPITSLRTNIEVLRDAPDARRPPSARGCSPTSRSRPRSSARSSPT